MWEKTASNFLATMLKYQTKAEILVQRLLTEFDELSVPTLAVHALLRGRLTRRFYENISGN